jgi:hypothetical protein
MGSQSFARGVVIYSGQHYRVFGGGQTTTQLARAFLRRGYEVLFVPLSMWARHGANTGTDLEAGVVEVTLDHSGEVVQDFMATHRPGLWLCGLPTKAALTQLQTVPVSWPTVYHIRDDWTAFAEDWWERETELQIAREVDEVTAITPQYAGLAGREVVVVANAHDPGLFRFRARPQAPERPRVVYWGSYGRQFWRDEIFRGIAQALPGWQFVLVGGYDHYWCPDGLPRNVERWGWRPVQEVGAIAEACDIGLIPFGTAISEHCDPIKAHEMVACGLPIVACGCPAVELLGLPACRHVEASVGAMVEALVLTQSTAVAVAEQQRFAATDTWDDRVRQFEEVVGIAQ